MPAGKIIGNGILIVVYVGYPIIGIDIGKIEQVKYVKSYPNAFETAEERFLHNTILSAGQTSGKSYVYTPIRRRTEIALGSSFTWSGHRKAVGPNGFERKTVFRETGHIILEKEAHAVTLFGR